MVRAHALRNSVPLKQRSRSHHVDRSHDNRGLGRVVEPIPVVRKTTSQRRHWHRGGPPILPLRLRPAAISLGRFDRNAFANRDAWSTTARRSTTYTSRRGSLAPSARAIGQSAMSEVLPTSSARPRRLATCCPLAGSADAFAAGTERIPRYHPSPSAPRTLYRLVRIPSPSNHRPHFASRLNPSCSQKNTWCCANR